MYAFVLKTFLFANRLATNILFWLVVAYLRAAEFLEGKCVCIQFVTNNNFKQAKTTSVDQK